MKINTTELRKALSAVKPAVTQNEIIEQSTSFAFVNKYVIAFNNEILIKHPIKNMDITGAIKADILYKLLNKIKADEIDIAITEKEIIFKSGKAKAGLAIQSEIKLPLDEVTTATEWVPIPEKFISALVFTKGSASKDTSRPVLMNVHITPNGIIESSDGFRITRVNINEIPITDEFLIPAQYISEIVKIKPTHMSSTEGWVHFTNENDTILSCRIIDDEFPNMDNHLKVDGVNVELPEDIHSILDKASIFTKEGGSIDGVVNISLKKDTIEIHSQSETGWFKEKSTIGYKEEPVDFLITPYLFMSIIKQEHNCVIGKDRIRFEGDDWEYIAMLRQKTQ